jgi:membrane protein implicated in regulation of membrane protease activity
MGIFEIWAIVAVVLIAIEVTAISGIGFLFAGFSALTVSILIKFGILETDAILIQIAVFLVATALWAGLLWKPVKKLFKRGEKLADTYAGSEAVVHDAPLIKGEIGNVRWSGTIMRAAIRSESTQDSINSGHKVWVHSMNEGVLQVDITKP